VFIACYRWRNTCKNISLHAHDLINITTFRFVGINASDINQTAGKYDPTARPPFDVGFEVSKLQSESEFRATSLFELYE